MGSHRAPYAPGVTLEAVVAVSARVAAESARGGKVALLAGFLAGVPEEQVATAVSVLSGSLPTPPLGLGPSRLRTAWRRSAKQPSLLAALPLTLPELRVGLGAVAEAEGPRSVARKVELLRTLLERATPAERAFLLRLCLGELRQGALDGVMTEAVAAAYGVSVKAVRRAHMLSGDLPHAAWVAATRKEEGLAALGLEVLRPVAPMLATTADTLEQALARHHRTILEWKLDGARIQVHKEGRNVRVFSRTLRDVTYQLPEVAGLVAGLAIDQAVLDGEAIALRADGRPEPFQTTMSRFSSAGAGSADSPPLTPFFFDVLYLDGESLVDRPQRERTERLRARLPSAHLLPVLETDSAERAEGFLRQALEAGHEGLVAKDPEAPYEAGRRGGAWIKVKSARTLDLVVLAVERGSGRRAGWWSNIHLGARDDDGRYVMLGKTFKGMTDAVLRWQTETFPELATHIEGHVMHLRPAVVAEIAFNEIQRSARYPAGLALRFARLERYRPDKTPEEADTIATVRALFAADTGEAPP